MEDRRQRQGPGPELPGAAVPRWLALVGAWSWRLLGGVGVAIVLASLVRRLELIVVPAVVALLLATVLCPPAAWLRRRGVPRPLATLIVFAAAAGALVGVGTWLVPVFTAEIQMVGPRLTDGFDRLQSWLGGRPLGLSASQVADYRQQLGTNVSDLTRQVPAKVAWGARTALDLSVGVVITVVLAVYAVNNGSRAVAAAAGRLDPHGAHGIDELADDLWATLGGYVRGAAANGVVNSTVLGVGLVVLGVPLVVPLVVVAFLSAFAPLVGAFVSGGVAALVALADGGPAQALAVVALVTGIHVLEGYVVGPLVMGRTLRIPPVAVLLALTVGGILGGAWGLLFAVPCLACTLAVWRWATAGSAGAGGPGPGSGAAGAGGPGPGSGAAGAGGPGPGSGSAGGGEGPEDGDGIGAEFAG